MGCYCQASTHNIHTGRYNAAEVSLGSTVDVVNDNHIIRRLEQMKYCCGGGTSRSVRRAMLGALCLCHCSLKSSGIPLLMMEEIESLVMRIVQFECNRCIIDTNTHVDQNSLTLELDCQFYCTRSQDQSCWDPRVPSERRDCAGRRSLLGIWAQRRHRSDLM